MLLLTKLDGEPVLINTETIKYIESVPDTLIFFLNGDTMMVKESITAITQLAIEFRAAISAHIIREPSTTQPNELPT